MNKATIHYYDIGDYLNRKEKLEIVKKFHSVSNIPWITLVPNEHGDWLSKRNDIFGTYLKIESEKKFDVNTKSIFITHSLGTATSRDSWSYNSSKLSLIKNMTKTISFYNEQRKTFSLLKSENNNLKFDQFASNDANQISWNDSLKYLCEKNTILYLKENLIRIALYRPFFKSNLYFDKNFVQRPYQNNKLFPDNNSINLAISVSGIGCTTDFSSLMINCISDLGFISAGQCFPLYYYEERQKQSKSLFDTDDSTSEYIRRDGVSDFILEHARKQYGISAHLKNGITKEDLFYYVYGFLHSPEYRIQFANDLKKMLPRLPLVEDVRDFWAFSKAGRALADLHIHYEIVPPAPGVLVLFNTIPQTEINHALQTGTMQNINYRVEKMRFGKSGVETRHALSLQDEPDAPSDKPVTKTNVDKTIIIYNSQITIENIPAKAYEYVVNGKSAIEWIMERYAITTHKESGIRNDPNDWAVEVDKPKYILDLLLSIINVSIQTVDIVAGLPKVVFE
jgi:predicted helicase